MNKTFLRILSVLSVAVFLFLSGCSKKSDSNPVGPTNPVTGSGSVTLNGGGYNNATINFGIGAGGYTSTDQMTACVIYGATGNDSLLIVIEFPGKSTGNYQWQAFTQNSSNVNGVAVNVYNSKGTNNYFIPAAGGKTNVSTYGSVGQTIEGTFNGTIQDAVTSSTTITISGSFKVLRVPDE